MGNEGSETIPRCGVLQDRKRIKAMAEKAALV
jgi:hypothetical protein